MKLGILADIHEDVKRLESALKMLRDEGVDRIVVLGDVFDSGAKINETVSILVDAQVIGVWGNHDMGLCHDRQDWIFERFNTCVLDFFSALTASLIIDDLRFTHGAPCWDPTSPEDYYIGPRAYEPDGVQASFEACDERVIFIGHHHRWFAGRLYGCLDWNGETPFEFDSNSRHLFVIHAVMDGWCAMFDTNMNVLYPIAINR